MKGLFLLQLPPPLHGASSVNLSIKNSKVISNMFNPIFIDISTAKDVNDIARISALKIGKSVLIVLRALIAFVRSRPNFVYITISPLGPAFIKDGIVAILLKSFGAKLVLHLHGKGVKAQSHRSLFSRLIYKAVFSGSETIVLSEKLLYDVESVAERKHVHVVNNGILSTTSIEEKSSNSHIKFLYLSNIIREKGSIDILEACRALKDLAGKFSVVMAGKFYDADFEKEFREILTNASNAQITVLDSGAFGNDKIELLRDSHVMILPTYYPNECFPLTLLEAMSARMAIISTDEGAITDIVIHGKNGLIVEKQSPASIAGAMRYLIENPDEIHRMGEAGQSRFSERYTFEIFEQRLATVLQDIANKV